MNGRKTYVGIDKDKHGGMTDTGKIIRDAWAFGLIPENETCAGWTLAAIEDLWRRTQEEWKKYGFRVHNLPEDIRERYLRIQNEALERARATGWRPELEDDD